MATGLAETDVALPEKYRQFPLRALRISARSKLAQYLDPDGVLTLVSDDLDIVNNYNGLAELIGFSYIEIRNFMRRSSPTTELLDAWTRKEPLNATLGKLWDYLYQMERMDVLTDCRRTVVRDADAYFEQQELEKYDFPIQDPEVSNSQVDREMEIDDLEGAAVDDIRYGTKTTYDAFVSYNEEPKDLEFVKKMIRELEGNQNLKLFVPGRDDIPGAAKYVVTAAMIEKRCRRVIIVLSESFGKSVMCDFQVKFAQALAPGARSKRLIPVLIEKSPIPRILKFLTVCDFAIRDMEDWVWDRLSLAVKAPLPQPSSASMRNEPESQEDQSDSLGNISLELSGIYSSFRHNQDSHRVRHLSTQSCSASTSREKEPESPPQVMRLGISKDNKSLQQRQNSNYVTQSGMLSFSPTLSHPTDSANSITQSEDFNNLRYHAIENVQPSAVSREYASLSMETDFENVLDESISSTEGFRFVY
nr:myeloid differentiation factor 88 [Sinanodonta woodiana]